MNAGPVGITWQQQAMGTFSLSSSSSPWSLLCIWFKKYGLERAYALLPLPQCQFESELMVMNIITLFKQSNPLIPLKSAILYFYPVKRN